MKKLEIRIGGHYSVKVSGKLTIVKVDEIGKRESTLYRQAATLYHVTNLTTGRKLTFHSAQKFRQEVPK